MSQMLKSSGAMGLATLTSRVLGMVREMVYANFMGDGPVAGAFKLAFTIPNLFRRLLGEGALTAAFIPVFKEKEKTAGEAEMWRAANAVISGLIVAASVVVGLVLLGVSLALAFGTFENENTRLMLRLLQVMFPNMLLVCLAAVFMGMLNARGHFFIPALGATMLNVVMIATVLFLAPLFGKTLDVQIFGLAFGVLIAGVAQAAFQLPVLRREGFRFQWVTPWGDETVRRVVRQMIPGTIGIAAFQLNVILTQGISFWVDPSIIASFDYAVRLMELPQGVFGISLATFLLPTLAGLAAEKKLTEFRTTLGQAMSHLLFVNALASILLIVLAEPIVRLLFERGAFVEASTHRAALALYCLAPGLLAFSFVNILARAFFALNDTATPMKVSIVCLLVNLLLAIMLVFPFRQAGLGLANTASAVINMTLLVIFLRRKLETLDLTAARRSLVPVLIGTALAGVLAWEGSRLWEQHVGHAGLIARIGAVFVPAAIAAAAYFGVAFALHVPSAREMTGLVLKRLKR
ncbi:MAG TPA: murein biosynthesis integral membrane protein MurJ [Roseimicrobium sp.]|nr:murein biosynthesis integral membrane protein MurJ [Roseimicrobium sp.]